MAENMKVLREKQSGEQDCIIAGIHIGDPRKNPHPHGRAYALVPDGTSIQYIEQPEFPPRRTGAVKLNDPISFLEYWTRQKDATSYIYGSMEPAQFLAVFNEHGKGEPGTLSGPGWRDHRALLTLTHSAEWATWMKMNNQAFDGNEAFARWLEDNLPDIAFPEPAKFMEIALNMRVKQDMVFGNKVNLTNGEIVLQYTNIVDGSSTNAAGERQVIPENFTLNIPVFKGLASPCYDVNARFRYRSGGGKLSLRYELVRPAKVMEKAFKDLLADIETKSGTKILFGQPE